MIKFGTSGFRGIIGDNWTKDNIQKIGFALRKMIESENKKANIIIGFDNRFMGRESAQWFCEAVCSVSIHATFMNVSVPTPLIAFKAVTADFGIMITASHNPFCYNGIKIFTRGGKEADDGFCAKISETIGGLANCEPANFYGLVNAGIVTLSNKTDDYTNKICSLLDTAKIQKSGLKVLFNPMHGSGTQCVRELFEKIGIPSFIINENPDPFFGGKLPAPYTYNLTEMADLVVREKYDFGFALDGDGDRIAVIDGKGKFYDCNYLAAAFYYYLIQIKKQKGGAVKSFLTSNLIVKLCKKYGFAVHETAVGFKFLGRALESTDSLLAAESGGIAFRRISFSKDGITAAAVLIDLLAAMKKSISEIISEITEMVSFPSVYLEYAYPFDTAARDSLSKKLLAPAKPELAKVVKIDSFPDGFKVRLENDYWCSARLSGTENVLRLYTEMPNEAECRKTINIFEKFYGLSERQK